MSSDRHEAIAEGTTGLFTLPSHQTYTFCNLRGGIGKATLSFHLSFLADKLLAVDTCPQGNLSFFFDKNYYSNQSQTVRDMIIPHLIAGYGRASRCASYIGATNDCFSEKNSDFIRSSSELCLLPLELITSINQLSSLLPKDRDSMTSDRFFSLKIEIQRELRENEIR